MAYTQINRPIGVTTPLGPDVLLLRSATINEGLSKLFEIELDLVSENEQIDPDSLLGQPVTVRLEVDEGARRFFHGHVSRFAAVGGGQQPLSYYRATLLPSMWLLTRAADCRLFKSKTVPDIVKQVLGEAGVSIKDLLQGSYPKWDCCVQYRETHFNFVCRLMEQEGIYWFFTHAEGAHTLVLVDAYSGHSKYPGYAEIRYHPEAKAVAWESDFLYSWSQSRMLRSGSFVHHDFDFEKPKVNLLSTSVNNFPHAQSSYEIYDYPGEYKERDEGDRYARVRLEELQADHEIFEGEGVARGMAAGHLFKLTDSPKPDLNKEYLILSAEHHIQTDEFETLGTGTPSNGPVYQGSITAMDSSLPFRPPRITPKPIVQGPQTAIVVGEGEIDPDKYGRVKVRFHWDRNKDSSCWVRVSQLWAGTQWGGIQIPRVGQEVIVDYLEGDPDHPIITGRVYNADCMPPYTLPANKTQSGIKSRSSEGGGSDNFNEIRFEDKKGKEEVYVHAERNLTTMVEKDEDRTVDRNRTTTIRKDETLTISEGDRTETLEQGSDALTITQGDRSATISQGNDTLEVSLGNITIEAPAGTFSVSANQVEITGTTSVKIVCGGSTIEMNPAQISLSAPTIKIEASALTTIKGGMVQIN